MTKTLLALLIFLSSTIALAGPPYTTIQIRRDTAATWTAINPVLAAGECGYETDTRNLKIGNGTQTWTALAYVVNQSESSAITALTGDVSATGPLSAAATVNLVGGSTAALIHTAQLAYAAAASIDTPGTLVIRDGSGNFTGGTVTVTDGVFSGSSSGSTTLQASAVASGTLTLPAITDTLISQQSTNQGANRLTNKDFSTTSTEFVDSTDTTKELKFSESGATAGTALTLAGIQSTARTITFPDATGTVLLTSRNVNTTTPLTGGGALSADLTLGIPEATSSANGYLASADWTTFNAKDPARTLGNLTDATSPSVITVGSGTGAVIGGGTTLTVSKAGAAGNGYVSSADWTTFNGKVNSTAGLLNSYLDYTEIAMPSNPSSGVLRLYSKSGDNLYMLNSAGGETQISGALTNPMTTLGDVIYENSTPAPARLAGNTTSTKNFLTQTGTGSVSAAPSWGAIAAGDMPVATSSAAGAVSTTTQTMAGAKTWNDNQTWKTGSGGTTVGSYASGGWQIGTAGGTQMNEVDGGDTFSDPGLIVKDSASSTTTNVVGFQVLLMNEATGNVFAQWKTAANGPIGSVSATGTTAVLYNTTSDARLKTDATDVTGAIDTMRLVHPVDFRWKADGRQDQGFLAQELQQVYPYAVSGDPDSDVTKAPMSVDYGRITPLLAAAIKELIQENDALKARLDAAGL